MSPPPGLAIEDAVAEDAGELWTLQRAAFVDEAQAYGDPFILPLTESLDQVRRFGGSGGVLLKAVLEGRIVGAVRGRAAEGVALVSKLCVAPDLRRRGIARALMTALEDRITAAFPAVTGFAIATGHDSAANLRFYRGLGYHETHRERLADHLTMVHLRKPVPGRGTAAQTA
ncbi:GNAT family N-acetyltransferase [Streptomonospora sp. S1-112]|uniref:GNAT family N-acetyltransferase n=1 Tax=Streptomonospora mangrovi TaxID=2883123 RepID=A0A9X3NPD9_9ACTN|nr:GNAT family N-acetyltransferase [Streptomonospora mangrovi]MDA0567424.1 GNAT family N-acetyltransferase [Streptomonospora mangrovi]